MHLKAILADKNPYSKFLILVGIVLVSAGLFITLGLALASPLFGVDVQDPMALKRVEDPGVVSMLKFLQLLQGISAFLIPAFIMSFLISNSVPEFLGLKRKPHTLSMLLIIPAMIAAVPFINWLGFLNQDMVLPEAWKGLENWIKSMEADAAKMTKVFLDLSGPGDLLFILFLVAIIPAIGEELLFRGVIQKLFSDWTRNVHVAIILTAIIFSAMHMQFYGFLPRAILGIYLGYLYLWSGSIWLPILAHFVNNGAAVLFQYINQNSGWMPVNPDTVGTFRQDLPLVATSFLILSAFSYVIYRLEKRRSSF